MKFEVGKKYQLRDIGGTVGKCIFADEVGGLMSWIGYDNVWKRTFIVHADAHRYPRIVEPREWLLTHSGHTGPKLGLADVVKVREVLE